MYKFNQKDIPFQWDKLEELIISKQQQQQQNTLLLKWTRDKARNIFIKDWNRSKVFLLKLDENDLVIFGFSDFKKSDYGKNGII